MTRVHAAQGANISSAVEKDYKKYKKIRNNQAVVGWSDFLLYSRM